MLISKQIIYHFSKDAADCPHVNCKVEISLFEQLFWRFVGKASYFWVEFFILQEKLGNPEINDLQHLNFRVDNNILRADISVNDSSVMDVFDSLNYFVKVERDIFTFQTLHIGFEVFFINKIEHL